MQAIWPNALGALTLLMSAPACLAQDGDAHAPPPGSPFTSEPLGDGPWHIATETADLHVEVVARDLVNPWGIAFLPDGDILVTERPGRLRVIRDGVLDPEPVAGLPDIYAFGIAGLTSVVADPEFAENRTIYLSYSKPAPGDGGMRANATLAVARAIWDGGPTLSDVSDIFVADAWYGAPPLPDRCCGQGPAFGSFGARMVFGPDGYLYVASGDRNWGERVQEPGNHFGKIVRLHANGGIPADNPFVGQADWKPEIWTLGHRNPTGLTVHPDTGEIWETEFGPRGGDELNRIDRGANYGWIDVTQGQHYDGTPAKAVRDAPGMVDPVYAWLPESHNPGNLDFYSGAMFPQWEGDLLVAMLNRSLERLTLGQDGQVAGREVMLGELGQRLRDVRVAPDGSIYVLTDQTDGAVLRITPGK